MLKNFIRQITPPILFVLARSFFQRLRIAKPIYEGLFLRRDQLPLLSDSPFEHPNWIGYVSDRAKLRKAGIAAQDMHEICFSLLASLVSHGDPEVGHSVIDFGGGVGMYWPTVKAQNKIDAMTSFVVVDSPRNCEIGRALFSSDRVIFSSSLEQAFVSTPSVHVLNVASTLQYCLDYEAVIALICSSRAAFIVVSRHPAPPDGQLPAYTVQNVTTELGFCGQISVVLLSVQVLVSLMAQHGYVLVADYYSDADSGKYWKNSKQPIPRNYRSIIDHAVVFQKRLTTTANCEQSAVARQ